MKAPKIPLQPSLSVATAAIKNRALYVVIQRSTPKYESDVREMMTRCQDSKLLADLESSLARERDWHVCYLVGECLTLKGAQNQLARSIEMGFEGAIHCYSADEVRAVRAAPQKAVA